MADVQGGPPRPLFQDYRSPLALARASGAVTYFSGKVCPRGHNALRRSSNGQCCECSAVYARTAYAAGIRPSAEARVATNARWNASPGNYAAKLRWKQRDPRWAWVVSATGGARTRARKTGIPFDLTNEYMRDILPTHCPALGCELVFGPKDGLAAWNSPTIDRIIPEFGYIVGNVAVISHRANAIKSDASAQEVMQVARWLTTL